MRHSVYGMFVSVVSLFFILSGFGIYQSLEKKHFTSGNLNYKSVTRFFVGRLVKLFPMYWFAIVVYHLYDPAGYPFHTSLRQFFSTIALVPLEPAPQFLWFMTAILQCYLWAPFLFLIQRKAGLRWFLCGISGVVALVLIFWRIFANTYYDPNLHAFLYQNFLMAHVIIFALGMSIAQLITVYPNRFKNPGLALFFLAGLAVFAKLTLDVTDKPWATVPFIFFNFAFCLYLISIRPRLPFQRIFITLGNNSMPLYLFHVAFFALLIYLGIIGAPGIIGSVVTLSLMPALVVACIAIQRIFGFGANQFMNWFSGRILLRGSLEQARHAHS